MAFMGHKESCGESKREPRYMAAPALIARATPSARLFEPNPVSYNPSSKARAKSSGLGACDAREALRTRASPAAFGASCERCCAVAIPTCRILCRRWSGASRRAACHFSIPLARWPARSSTFLPDCSEAGLGWKLAVPGSWDYVLPPCTVVVRTAARTQTSHLPLICVLPR